MEFEKALIGRWFPPIAKKIDDSIASAALDKGSLMSSQIYLPSSTSKSFSCIEIGSESMFGHQSCISAAAFTYCECKINVTAINLK